jgi:hypothetical protein
MLIKPFNGSPANHYFISIFRVLAAAEIKFPQLYPQPCGKYTTNLKCNFKLFIFNNLQGF